MFKYPRKKIGRSDPKPLWPRLIGRTIHTPNGCWIFTKESPNGHPRLDFNGKREFVHRLSWMIHRGPIPEGCWVLHKCVGRGDCWNPTHLYLGTPKENCRDRKVQGHEPNRKGERNGRAKLSPEDVLAIRSEPLTNKAQIARQYGVSRSSVSAVILGRSWSHL